MVSNDRWRRHETAHFIFHYRSGWYAAQRLSWLEGRAEDGRGSPAALQACR